MNVLQGFTSTLIPSRLATIYANWCIKPTLGELKSYNQTKRILLTFDDFATEERIAAILTILKNEHILAAFFLTGDFAYKNPKIVKKIQKAGHWLGNHTKSHTNLLDLTDQEVKKEILGGPDSFLLRPPFGKYDKRIRRIAEELGYKICYWSVDSDDWQGISKAEIVSRVMKNVHSGSCILLHLHGKYTLDALPLLIEKIRLKGLLFCNNRKDLII